MNLNWYIANKITFKSSRKFSKLIVRLSIIAIALSVAVMVITVSVVMGFKQEIQRKITGFSAPIQVTGEFLNSSYENAPFVDKAETRETIQSHDFVDGIQAFSLKPAILKASDEFEGVVIKGVDSSYNWEFFENNLIRGRPINFAQNEQSRDIILSSSLATKLKLDTGMKAQLWFVQEPPAIKQVDVVGIYKTDIEDIDNAFIIADLDIIRQINDWQKNQIGGYEVLVKDFDIQKIQSQNSDLRYAIDIDLNSLSIIDRFPQIFDWLSLLDKNVQIILVLMTIVAIINMITALLIMILERTQMIGVLKSMGYSNFGLRTVFVYNAAYFIGFGLILGNAIGIGLLFVQEQWGLVKLSSDYYLTEVPVSFEWTSFLLIDLGTLIVCSAAMLLPSYLVTRILPIKALRFN